jgi:hypothetical protein
MKTKIKNWIKLNRGKYSDSKLLDKLLVKLGKKPKNINIPFDEFYNLYGKKIDRHKAELKWKLLTDKQREKVISILPDYIQENPVKKFRKSPRTFLNGRCWEDEIENNEVIRIR